MLIMLQLKYGKNIKDSLKYQLEDDLLIDDNLIISKGTEIITHEGEDFGYVIIPEGTKDKEGNLIERPIFRY